MPGAATRHWAATKKSPVRTGGDGARLEDEAKVLFVVLVRRKP